MADRTYTLTPSMSDRDERDSVTTEDVEPDYECGVNGCQRTVDSESSVCWQHSAED